MLLLLLLLLLSRNSSVNRLVHFGRSFCCFSLCGVCHPTRNNSKHNEESYGGEARLRKQGKDNMQVLTLLELQSRFGDNPL